MSHPQTGLLLINLGTPDSPHPRDVRPYLDEFLNDRRVIDIAPWKRWLLLNLIILRFRPKASGEAYAKIWTDRGSPLMYHTEDLTKKVQERAGDGVRVEFAMRYGQPSIASVLDRFRRAGIDQITVFPLYPQYSSAATGSSVEKVYEEAGKLWNTPSLSIVPAFYDHPLFIECCAEVSRPYLEQADPELVFFSYHGLPERHVTKSDDTGSHCLKSGDCCGSIVEANRNCYRAQCFATTRALGDRLGIPEDRRVICFQSRLGRDPWIKPYTDELFEEHAKKGVKRIAVLTPAFVADCLETLEEIGMRGAEQWQEEGGESLVAIPCINAVDSWADATLAIAREHSAWLGAPRGASAPHI
jgi:ferrochelatase